MPESSNSHLGDFLTYVPEHCVVICKPCGFAVQTQAIASHLLKHRIYRLDRKRILARLASFRLLAPDDIELPSPNSPPVSHLPVHDGYVCSAPGCSHLCISEKRMIRHWREAHREHDSKNVRAKPTKLQTFFRGNKIRYFRVDCDSTADAVQSVDLPTPFCDEDATRPSQSSSPTSTGEESAQVVESASVLDMQSLRYLRHYLSQPELVPVLRGQESDEFWSGAVMEEAFKHDFLMLGILGIAAVHLASQSQTQDEWHKHHSAALQYQSTGTSKFRLAFQHPTNTNSIALVAYTRYIGIQRVLLQEAEEKRSGEGADPILRPEELTETFALVRGAFEVMLNMQHLLPQGCDFIFDEQTLHDVGYGEQRRSVGKTDAHHPPVPTQLHYTLRVLPNRLQALNAIQDDDELATIADACTALTSSAAMSYATDEMRGRYLGFASFPLRAPARLFQMLEARRPAAYVLLLLWWPLMRRLEQTQPCIDGQAARLAAATKSFSDPSLEAAVADLLYLNTL